MRASIWNFGVCIVLSHCYQYHGDKKLKYGLLSTCCICLQRIVLCYCPAMCFLPLPRLFRDIEEVGAKNILQTISSHCSSISCSILFWSILFLSKSQQRGIPGRLFDKCSHLFIRMSYNYLHITSVCFICIICLCWNMKTLFQTRTYIRS